MLDFSVITQKIRIEGITRKSLNNLLILFLEREKIFFIDGSASFLIFISILLS